MNQEPLIVSNTGSAGTHKNGLITVTPAIAVNRYRLVACYDRSTADPVNGINLQVAHWQPGGVNGQSVRAPLGIIRRTEDLVYPNNVAMRLLGAGGDTDELELSGACAIEDDLFAVADGKVSAIPPVGSPTFRVARAVQPNILSYAGNTVGNNNNIIEVVLLPPSSGAADQLTSVSVSGANGSTTAFTLTSPNVFAVMFGIWVNSVRLTPGTDFTYVASTGVITFTAAPANAATIVACGYGAH